MSKATYQDYLRILDKEITLRNNLSVQELLTILEMSQDGWERSQKFTEKRRHIWFRLLMKQFDSCDCRDLVYLNRKFNTSNINPDIYFANFFQAWEANVIKKLTGHNLIEILRIYKELNVAFPDQLMVRWCDHAKQEVSKYSRPSIHNWNPNNWNTLVIGAI